MILVGIFDGDTINVDQSIEPQHNHIVLAVVNEEFTVKRVHKKNGGVRLLPESPALTTLGNYDGTSITRFSRKAACSPLLK